ERPLRADDRAQKVVDRPAPLVDALGEADDDDVERVARLDLVHAALVRADDDPLAPLALDPPLVLLLNRVRAMEPFGVDRDDELAVAPVTKDVLDALPRVDVLAPRGLEQVVDAETERIELGARARRAEYGQNVVQARGAAVAHGVDVADGDDAGEAG